MDIIIDTITGNREIAPAKDTIDNVAIDGRGIIPIGTTKGI
jgi:hypothetical protein